MASLMGEFRPMRDIVEHERRKPGALGRPIHLADGKPWLFAEPSFRPTSTGLTTPNVNSAIDRFHEQIILGDDVSMADILAIGRDLLLANYDLTDAEVAELLEVGPGAESEMLARAVLESLFGPDQRVRGYVNWVRASLLANGLTLCEIPAFAIHDVLTILTATNRTIPPSQFVDVCRAARDRDSLERLV